MNSEFFKNFPSLNSNSKENRRHRQIDREFKEYLKTNKIIHDNSKPPKVKNENCSPSIFDFVEEKNREVNERRLESKRVYQKILQDQINEARQRKEMQKLKEEQEKFLAERRLQIQLEKLREEALAQNKISKSENDKSSSNDDNKKQQKVYQYFSKSSKIDSGLFGYRKKYFDDLNLDDSLTSNLDDPLPTRIHTYPIYCRKCHRSLDKICRECDDDESQKEATKSTNDSFKTANALPFSFNIPDDSIFRIDEEAAKTYAQMENYEKLYGDLGSRRIKKKKESERIKASSSDPLDELLSNAQYAVITGYAKNLLKSNESQSK